MVPRWEIVFAVCILVKVLADLEGVPVFKEKNDTKRRINVIGFWALFALIIAALLINKKHSTAVGTAPITRENQ